MYYIYQIYDDKNNILYVGKTQDLKRRIGEHKNSERFHGLVIKSVYYAICESSKLAADYEIYYINKLSPKCNKQIPEHALVENDIELKPLDFEPLDLPIIDFYLSFEANEKDYVNYLKNLRNPEDFIMECIDFKIQEDKKIKLIENRIYSSILSRLEEREKRRIENPKGNFTFDDIFNKYK